MLILDKLDKIAEEYIPNETHPYLHVHCQHAWVDIMFMLIDLKQVRASNNNLHILAVNWEDILYRRYAPLN